MFLDSNLKVFAGSGNPKLAQRICEYLHTPLGTARIDRFPDGEKIIKCDDDVRGKDCFIVQPTCDPVDANLVELLIFLDTLKRASASRVTAVIPYFGYARQDRKDEGRVPITAKLTANLITTAGADRVLTMDLHAAQLQGFFDIPVDHLMAEPVLRGYFLGKKIDRLTVLSPDVGNIKRASRYAQNLGGELAIIHKRRLTGTDVVCDEIIGELENRNILMIDDMISTGGTVCEAAEIAKGRGAKKIYVGATHGLFSGQAVERLSNAQIDEVIVTDTIPAGQAVGDAKKIKILSVAELLGEAIRRIHKNESISALFK